MRSICTKCYINFHNLILIFPAFGSPSNYSTSCWEHQGVSYTIRQETDKAGKNEF